MRHFARVTSLAERQAGQVSRRQLMDIGVSSSAIGRACASHMLEIVHPGVYRFGGAPDSTEAKLWAAILWAGPGAALSHLTAGWWFWELDGLGRRPPREVALSVPSSWHLKAPRGVRVHRARTLRPGADFGLMRGLPCTSLERTLVDLAGVLTQAALDQAVDSAARRNRGVIDSTRDALERLGTQGRAGTQHLATLTSKPPLSPSGSALEVLVRRAIKEAKLPDPMPQVVIHDPNREQASVADFFWPKEGVVLLVQSREFHSTAKALEKDFAQIAGMSAAGVRVLPVTTKRFMEDRKAVMSELKAALGLS
jgi:hypothetical protein